MKTTRSEKPFSQWLDDKIDEWGLGDEVEQEVNRLMVQQKISDLRRRRGMSQAQLAKRTGVSQPMIAKFESGRFQNVTLRTLVRTARALGAAIRIDIVPLRQPRKRRAR